MERRFYDKDIWANPSFRKLSSSLKNLYFYVWSKCDACGVYVLDCEYLKIDTGSKFNEKDFDQLAEIDLKKIAPGKFFFLNFIEVNYTKLKENYNPHKPAFRCLQKHNINLEEISSLRQASFKLEGEDEYKEEGKGEEEGKRGQVKINEEPELVFPWNTESFMMAWGAWKKYKKDEKKFTFKSKSTEQIALKELTELSNGREDTAIRIIQKSIASGWAGLFKLSDEKGKSVTAESLRDSDDLIASMSKNG